MSTDADREFDVDPCPQDNNPPDVDPWPDESYVLDVEACPDEVARWLASADIGVGLLTPVGQLDADRLSRAGLIDAATGVDRVIAHYVATKHRLLAKLADLPSPSNDKRAAELDKDYVREEVACALRLSFGTAADALAHARLLTRRLPSVLDSLERGDIHETHARILVEQTLCLDDDRAAHVAEQLLPQASEQTPAQFRRAVRRAVLAADPDAETERRERATRERDVRVMPLDDGMAGIWGVVRAEDAAAVKAVLQEHADRLLALNDGRDPGECRSDALVALLLDTPTDDASRTTRARKPLVQVTVALSTLLALDEQPGDLHGYGPIPAALARALAFDPTGTWRRLVTDERGVLVDCGRSTYTPPTRLADFVEAKHRTCRMRGCSRPACRCEIDHLVAWADGGLTNEQNLEPLCSRHHHLKHEAGWTLQRDGDDVRWTTPTGHTYTDPIATYPLDATAAAPRTEHPIERDPDPPPF